MAGAARLAAGGRRPQHTRRRRLPGLAPRGGLSRPLAAAALACGLVLSVPFWVSRWLPFTDVPLHLGVASVLLHQHDPAWGFAEHFIVEWDELTPYWTLYLVLDGLGRLLPPETAMRLVLTAYAIGLPFAAIAICRAFQRPAWAGLLAAPLALGANLYFGFVSYCLGLVLALFGLTLVERECNQPRAARALVLLLLAVILFFTHVQALAWLFAAAAIVVSFAEGGTRSRLRALVPLVPAAVLFAAWFYGQFLGPRQAVHARYNFGQLGRTGARFASFRENLVRLPESLAGSFADGSDDVLLALWAGLMAWLLARRDPLGGRRRPAVLVGFSLACYFLMPMAITGQWYINSRFAMTAALLLVLLVPPTAPARPAVAFAIALAVLGSANAVRLHLRFDREAAGFEAALAQLPSRPRVIGLMYDDRGRVLRRWPYLHFEQYAMVRRGGVASNSLAKSPPFPIRHHHPGDFPAPDVFRPERLTAAQLAAYDVALVRGIPPPGSALLAHARQEGAHGQWTLWVVKPAREE